MHFSPTIPFDLPELPPAADLLTLPVAQTLLEARVELGELKGYSLAMPNPMLLLSPAIVRESVASSEIEDIHTTVEMALQQVLFPEAERRPADKEVLRYGDAVRWGLENLEALTLSSRLITGIQQHLLPAQMPGYRQTPNQIVNSVTKEVIYSPPRASGIGRLMGNWERFIDRPVAGLDPLLRCVIGHYQFEAIHPFGDGNGRTGRILMILQLVQEQILTQPTLFISGYINEHRPEYYRQLLSVSAAQEWEPYLLFMLQGFYEQARVTKTTLLAVMQELARLKEQVRGLPQRIGGEVVEAVFAYPVATPAAVGRHTGLHYKTASRQLAALAEAGLLERQSVSRYQFYLNRPLLTLLR